MIFRKIFAAILCLFLSGCFFLPRVFAVEYVQNLPSSELVELSRARLEEALSEMGEMRRHEIELVRAPKDMACPAGEITSEVSFPKRLEYGRQVPASIQVFLDGKAFRRTVCYFRLKIYEKVLVAKKDLSLEHAIEAADVHLEEREIPQRGADYVTNPQEVIGKVPSRVIRSGTLITKRMVQTPIVMDVGAAITIQANYHGVRISTDGVALERGRVGHIIRVRNTTSRKVMRGKVIDATTVELIS